MIEIYIQRPKNVYLGKSKPHPSSKFQFKITRGFAPRDIGLELALGTSVWIFQGKHSLVVGLLHAFKVQLRSSLNKIQLLLNQVFQIRYNPFLQPCFWDETFLCSEISCVECLGHFFRPSTLTLCSFSVSCATKMQNIHWKFFIKDQSIFSN